MKPRSPVEGSGLLHRVEDCPCCLEEQEARRRQDAEIEAERAEQDRFHGPTGRLRTTCDCLRCSGWRANEASRPAAVRHGEQWSVEDFPILFDPKLDLPERARRLGRTVRATSGAHSKFREFDPATPKEGPHGRDDQ